MAQFTSSIVDIRYNSFSECPPPNFFSHEASITTRDCIEGLHFWRECRKQFERKNDKWTKILTRQRPKEICSPFSAIVAKGCADPAREMTLSFGAEKSRAVSSKLKIS